MTKTFAAIYENGVLKLPEALPLPEHSLVTVTIESELRVEEDPERSLWLKASEDTLAKAWDNSSDDVFNDLLTR
jgi:predicted DNA-binding antitoxin AbrB/MazE fold protein